MKSDRKIIHIMILMGMLFLLLVAYLTWFELFMSEKVVANSYNRRQWQLEDNTVRGRIFDRKGVILAKSEGEETARPRIYPFGPLYSHVIGYSSKAYGKSLLELIYNKQLLGINTISSFFNIGTRISGTQRYGNELHLTVDHSIQKIGRAHV